MRYTTMPFTLLLIVLLLVLVGCGPSSTSSATKTACDISSNILGNIISISHASVSGSTTSFVGAIFIDGTKEKQRRAFDKVSISVAIHTQIFEKQEQKCRKVSFDALKIAQRVQIQSTGVVRETYPPQIDATEIVILAPKA